MTRRIKFIMLILAAVLLLAGCTMQTVEDMYRVPRRSDDYNDFQTAIDTAMSGLEYAAPLSGEHQQTVQMADLNGDGVEEYLLFARGKTEKPMHILIFHKTGEGYRLLETIESRGAAFEQVEYVDIDGRPGMELVVGRQVSDQVLRSVSVYTFARGEAEQLMVSNYSKFLTCDLDQNGSSEVMVIHPGETDANNAVATLYSFRDGTMERSREAELSGSVDSVKRIMASRLDGHVPAVYVASAVNESAVITDVFALKEGLFTNISFSNESGTSVQTLRNYYVYADDIDNDGVLELPSLITMRPISDSRAAERQYLIRWFAMDLEGREVDKLHTFHNFQGGWYLELGSGWADRVTVVQNGSTYMFHIWDEAGTEASHVLTVYALTGSDREVLAAENDRFVLYRTEGVLYAARLEDDSTGFDITQEDMINSFHLIHQDWKTGET